MRAAAVPIVVVLAVVRPATSAPDVPDAATVMARSMDRNRADWAAAPHFEYVERTRNDEGVRTYNVIMLFGTPYKQLVMADGKALTLDQQREEQEKLEAERVKRARESPAERTDRIAEYQRTRERAHRIIEEIPRAFDFRITGKRRADSRRVYVVAATPREAYDPPDAEGRVLTAMRGEFWIDTRTYQWVRGTARVLRPVSIEGFVARVEPGTEFEIEQMPVERGVWLPKHFEIRSRSAILFLFHHHSDEDDTFFSYRRIAGP